MVDGDPGTFYWSNSSPGSGDHVTVDLGASRAIGDITLLMGKPGSPNDYLHAGALEVSRDGVAWTRLATVSGGDGGIDTLWLDEPNQTRFLRVQGVKRATGYGYSLWELEVYPAS